MTTPTDQEREHCKRVAGAMLQEYTGTPPAPSLLRSLVAMTIRRERAAARAERWQPIATAPRDGTWLLAYARGPMVARWASNRGGLWEDSHGGSYTLLPPTHWMPLPPAPEVP